MIELFLDNKPAVLRDNASIKLTRENAYFTKCGSYTYDVELPLQCVENRAIFGSINRKDVATIAQELHAVLRVDNVVLLDGKAVVNHVTDSAVKVQLLGGNSEMNFYAKGSELFIDELDLGDWMNEVRIYRPDGEPIEHFRGNCLLMAKREQDDMLAAGNFDQQLQYLANRWWKNESADRTTDKCVAFPVINESADYNAESSHLDTGAIVNGYILRKGDGQTFYPQFRWTWPVQEQIGSQDKFPQVIPSYQPMLTFIIKKVLNAVGYPLDNDSELALLGNSLFRHIFIVTANNRIEISKALPHWTVNDFITQIENFLGIVIVADEITKLSHIIKHDTFWNEQPVAIEHVVDEYDVDIDKDETNDISNGNIGFASIDDGVLHISKDILQETLLDIDSFSSFGQMADALANNLISTADKAKIFELNGHHFYVGTDQNGHFLFREANQYRMLQRNADKWDLDVELKIVPCPITQWHCPLIASEPLGVDASKIVDIEIGTATVDVYTRPDVAHIGTDNVNNDNSTLDIEQLIAGNQVLDKDEQDGNDLIYVGVVPAQLAVLDDGYSHASYPMPVGCPNLEINTSGTQDRNTINQREFLTLHDYNDGSKTLGTEAFVSHVKIDTTVKHCIKFIHHGALKPTLPFVIHNKKFACERLEFNITASGISPLITGYFYRIIDNNT
ncbi:MAG: hypothetical protein IJT30_08685 [Muribaculaceae bacterium]|nr:hypothetical protein [Muribaculaceae bacterium]